MSNNKKTVTCFAIFLIIFGLVTGCATNEKNEWAGSDNKDKVDDPTTIVTYDGDAEIG